MGNSLPRRRVFLLEANRMLHYLDPHPEGSPAVLLLHGLGSEGASWILQLGALTEAGYRPVAPDTAGFGASAYDGRGWSIRRSAQELKGLVHALGCGAVHVVGLSMGGVIAQQFALDYPEQVRKVALANTFAVLRPRRFSGWVYFLARMLVAHLVGIERQAGLVAMRVFPEVGQESLRRQLVDSIYR
ncbi:MAG: alpha/beta hydrolase, partial [Chloroflexi bacterium]|nr:alpha/beta hydrolase [Chloroflexota bacterium]